MQSTWRALLACVACGLVGLGSWSAVARAEEASLAAGGSVSLKETPLAVEDVQPLIGDEGIIEERKAVLSAPESSAQRLSSATAFESLTPAKALSLVNSAFPSLGGAPADGLAALPEGQTVSSFIGPNAASVLLPDGHSEILETIEPIAVETSPDQWTGADLALQKSNGAFVPKLAASQTRIPSDLSEGISSSGSGVSLTPLLASGSVPASASSGVSDGYAVFWGGLSVGADVDMLAKPNVDGGFDLETVLRSERSPETLRFAVGLPEHAALEQPDGDKGPVLVISAGKAIATILPVTAVDAQGTQVPGVTMSTSGKVLTITVPHPVGLYAYPLDVDPVVFDEWVTGSGGHPTNWRFESNPVTGSKFISSGWGGTEGLTISASGSYSLGEDGMLIYPIRPGSNARITQFSADFQSVVEGHNAEVVLDMERSNKEIEKEMFYPYNTIGGSVLGKCLGFGGEPLEGCGFPGSPGNLARLALRATGTGSGATVNVTKATVEITDETLPTGGYNKSEPTLTGGFQNVLYGSGSWIGPHSNSAFEIDAKDEDLGVAQVSTESGGWSQEFTPYASGECEGVQCNPSFRTDVPYSSKMVNGEHSIITTVSDTSHEGYLTFPERPTLKVDAEPPHGIVLSGLGSGGQVGGGETQLKAEATDGSGTTPSSGMKSLTFYIDGNKVAIANASCSPGPCTAHSASLAIFGDKYATGQHTVTVEATDNAGNSSTASFPMIVHPTTPIALGPGSVNPQSGEYMLSATDVSMGGGLAVSRSYDSEHQTAGEGGPLGAQWALSLGGQESVVKQSTGGMVLTEGSGAQVIFAPNGSGGYISPAGDSNLTLSTTPCVTGQTELSLKNAAADTTTCFYVPSGGSGEVWSPRRTEGPAIEDKAAYSYETVEVPVGSKKYVTRPHEALAPVPAGVSCTTLKAGCRALTFNYATSTTAKGEARSEWGDIEGNLTRVYYTAWDPVSKAMKTEEVARYEYDNRRRLRTVWDPRITPTPLKTYYGYDSENHVTALTPPGQETWGFTYGTIPGIEAPGAILKVTRAPASATVWSGEALANTEAPHISGSPAVGVRMATSDGVWTGSPIVYEYQWTDCNYLGLECKPISKANNPNYTPTSSDVGHELVAQVTATNGGGSVTSSTAATGLVQTLAGMTEYALPISSAPWGVAIGSVEEPWFTNPGTSRVGKIASGSTTEWVLPSGSVPRGITKGSDGKIWFANEGTSKISKISTSGTEYTEYALPAASKPYGMTTGPDGDMWFAERSGKIGKITPGGAITEYAFAGGPPMAITTGPDGKMWFTLYGGRIGKMTATGELEFSEYNIPPESIPEGITPGPDENVWFTDEGTSKIGKITTAGVITEYALPAGSQPQGIVKGSDKNLWFADYGTSKIGKITPSGAITEYPLPPGSKPEGITASGENLWYTEEGTNEIAKFSVKPEEGTLRSPQPGSTVEYNVLLSGTGLPSMTKTEVEKWGQTDTPTEVTAVFPPDEPQSWPANDYKRATLYYRDSADRTVNVATPSGGISTSEYNEKNDITRSLSADNRAISLKEAKPAEIAHRLDTQSEYNSEGNELLNTLGPSHTVKLTNGKELTARNHTLYHYDEGAPIEGGPYRLVTKVTQGALTESEGEKDVRTIATGYSGQSNLGWKLREPTSVITDPGGLNLTRTISYEQSTGNVTETTTPASSKSSVNNVQTIYYTAASNPKYTNCGEHPEWARLPCQTQPAKQPGTSGLPNLPVTTYAYNFYNEPTKVTATVGTETRTTTATYDAASRPESRETSSTTGTSLPKVTFKYSKTTGRMIEESTSTSSLKSEYNTLEQLTIYTDADGNTTTYEYEKEKDYRLKKINDGKGTQTFEYDLTTGAVKELIDSSAGTFTGLYDAEENLIGEVYPNAMTAKDALNAAGEPTGVEYIKNTHCAKTCPEIWYSDNIVPSIHGQWMTQKSNEGTQTDNYDPAGRLTEALDNIIGVGCVTHIYANDEETNRLSMTTRPPGTGGVCTTEGGETQGHTYDPANRLLDAGTSYDPFGDTTKLPAIDAGGTELTSTFYQDGKLASQTQGTQTLGYKLDPDGRTREIVSTGKINKTEIQHYTSPSSANPAWTGELSTNYTRYITGIGGTLVAIQHNSEKAVLQLPNLHEDIIATATDSETVTTLASTISEASEYGVPTKESSSKYSWLGADEMPTTLPSGIIAMGARSYIPQLGRFLQADPRPGGSVNAYAYTYGDPINTTDLTGEWTFATPTWVQVADAGWGAREEERQLANEQAEREEAERLAAYAAEQAALWASTNAPSPAEGGPELPLGGSAGWECEYAAETGQEDGECGGSLNIVSDGAAGHGTPPPGNGKLGKANEGGLNCKNRSGCGKASQESGWEGLDAACAFLGWTTAPTRLACTIYAAARAGSHN